EEIQLSKDQLSHLKMAFDAFDYDKKGSISTSLVNTILGMLGHEIPAQELEEIIAEIDTWGTGELKFEEFCQLASHFLEEDTDTEAIQQELREAFRLYDKEGNGYITTEVFRDILHELDDALSPEELDMIIEEVDTDGSGTLDYDGEILRDAQEDLNKDQIALLKNAFNAFDQQKKGSIGTNMVGTILTMLGHELSENTLQEIISEVDEDGSGELEFEEFCTLAARFLVEEDTEAMQQELREAFRLYDKEGNGYITTAVFRDILHELDDKLSPEELDLMIEEIDADGSGTLDFDAKSIERSISLSPWVVRQVCARGKCEAPPDYANARVLRAFRVYGSHDGRRRLREPELIMKMGTRRLVVSRAIGNARQRETKLRPSGKRMNVLTSRWRAGGENEEMLRLSAIYMQGVHVCEHVLSYYVSLPVASLSSPDEAVQLVICSLKNVIFMPRRLPLTPSVIHKLVAVRIEPRRDLLGDSIQPCVIDVISSLGVTVTQLARAPNVYPELPALPETLVFETATGLALHLPPIYMSDNEKLKSLYFLRIFIHSYRLTTSLRGKICVRKIGKAIEAYRAAPLDSVHRTGSRDTGSCDRQTKPGTFQTSRPNKPAKKCNGRLKSQRSNLHRSARWIFDHHHTCPAMTNPFDTLEPTDKRGELPRCAGDSSSMLNKI
ncbi:Troponin C, isoform 1, partial [Trachymyrmex septentrionalis]